MGCDLRLWRAKNGRIFVAAEVHGPPGAYTPLTMAEAAELVLQLQAEICNCSPAPVTRPPAGPPMPTITYDDWERLKREQAALSRLIEQLERRGVWLPDRFPEAPPWK